MKHYSEFTEEYVQDICDALNEAEMYKLLGDFDKNSNKPFAPENFETLTVFLQRYVVKHIDFYNYLISRGLINRGRCPYTGERIDSSFPKWTFMRTRSVYVSHEGFKIMKKEDDEEYEKIMGHSGPKRKTGGCYIATVCYGNEFSPEVIVLKRFRDDILLKKWYGRILVKIYYLFSPYCAKRLKNKKRLNKFIRMALLDRIVIKIRNL